MADIFLSYSSEDRARVAPLAKALETSGFSLWWDRGIAPGADFAATIEREIEAAKAIVVCWSEAAARSQWVRDEATVGRRKGNLIPLLFAGDEPPMGFRQVQAIDFRDWRADEGGPAFCALRSSLAELVGRAPAPVAKPSWAKQAVSFVRRRRGIIFAGLGAAAVLAAVVGLTVQQAGAPKPPHIEAGRIALGGFTAAGDDAEAKEFASRLEAAFRGALTDFHIETVAPGGDPASAEFMLSARIEREEQESAVVYSLDDRKSGATVWSLQLPMQTTASAQAEMAARALQCAYTHLRQGAPKDMFVPFLRVCGKLLHGDPSETIAERDRICSARRSEPHMRAFCVVTAAEKAFALPPGQAREKGLIEAERDIKEALKTLPNNARLIFAMAWFEEMRGRWFERGEWLERAMASDPGLPTVRAHFGAFLADVGRMREATELYLQEFAATPVWPSGMRAARIVAASGDWPRARSIYKKAGRSAPQEVARHELSTLAWYGDPQEALADLKAAGAEIRPARAACLHLVIAARKGESVDRKRAYEDCKDDANSLPRNLVIAGDLDGALATIEANLKNTQYGAPQLFYPEMRPLWSDDRFWRIVAKMGLTEYWMRSGHWPDFCAEPDLPFDCKAKAAGAGRAEEVASTGAADATDAPN